jgi:hypothetical protein
MDPLTLTFIATPVLFIVAVIVSVVHVGHKTHKAVKNRQPKPYMSVKYQRPTHHNLQRGTSRVKFDDFGPLTKREIEQLMGGGDEYYH